MADPALADAIRASAGRLGVNPSDIATIMSYESGLRPDAWGGKGGNYYGLIQMGPEERAKYGVVPGKTSAVDQVSAAENFLRDRGVQPGMGLLDLYSTVNAGSPGLYNRSDAANGGAPGTVADKVATMAGHRMRADALLGGDPSSDPTQVASAPQAMAAAAPPVAAAGGAPLSMAPDATGGATPDMIAALTKAAQTANQGDQMQAPPAMTINYPIPPGIARMRAALLAANRGVS